jgi:hypothetical protein
VNVQCELSYYSTHPHSVSICCNRNRASFVVDLDLIECLRVLPLVECCLLLLVVVDSKIARVGGGLVGGAW